MRNKIIGRFGLGLWLLPALVAVTPAQAPVPAQITLVPSLKPGTVLTYSAKIHSDIGTSAHLDTVSEIEMRILPSTSPENIPGSFDAELRFTRFTTTVQADSSTVQQALAAQEAASDKAAQTMAPVHFQVDGQQFTVVSRPAGAIYDQPVEMLAELARTDTLPRGPAAVGARWTWVRSQPVPTLNYALPLTLDCQLTGVGSLDGQPTATITVDAHADATLPPGTLPASPNLAAEGLVPEVSLSLDTTVVSQYRLSDALLESATSQTHNQMHIRLVGPSPQAQTSDTDINSTGTLKLETVTP